TLLDKQIRCWTQSEPPRGSGWVRRRLQSRKAAHAPTRYREVVLTVSNNGFELHSTINFSDVRSYCVSISSFSTAESLRIASTALQCHSRRSSSERSLM